MKVEFTNNALARMLDRGIGEAQVQAAIEQALTPLAKRLPAYGLRERTRGTSRGRRHRGHGGVAAREGDGGRAGLGRVDRGGEGGAHPLRDPNLRLSGRKARDPTPDPPQ